MSDDEDENRRPRAPAPASEAWREEVHDLLSRGLKIDAVFRYRDEMGCGIKEAREAVTEIERNIRGR